MLVKRCILFIILLVIWSCKDNKIQPKSGSWRTILTLQDNKELPFLMEWKEEGTVVIRNAEERIEITDITVVGDSIIIEHPVFEGVFKGIVTPDSIVGSFVKPSLERIVPFKMFHTDAKRFDPVSSPSSNVTGNWEMIFSAHAAEDRYIAKGIFNQNGEIVTGTIRTTTGDYRYLEGVMDGTTMKLSTFDGAHAFLFEAEVKDSILFGNFYSGNHWKEPFSAKRNENYELPEENELTYLKAGYERFNFSFPDMNGNIVSLEDDAFKDKVVVVQIMGTWCPNCLEETQYYTEYLKKNPSKDLAFVSLAFEYAPKERAVKGIKRLISRVGVPYPVLLAQFGTSDKKKANEKLPMLNHVLSYPTTVFIDKSGAVRKIHTGFNGKATGKKYTAFTLEFESFLDQLLSE